jgi:hypothetical protein
MEEKIFPRPAVAAELEKYVEARLHTDGGPRETENQELQRTMAGSVANPIYVIVDPRTGEKLRVKAGFMTAERFIEFLRGTK